MERDQIRVRMQLVSVAGVFLMLAGGLVGMISQAERRIPVFPADAVGMGCWLAALIGIVVGVVIAQRSLRLPPSVKGESELPLELNYFSGVQSSMAAFEFAAMMGLVAWLLGRASGFAPIGLATVLASVLVVLPVQNYWSVKDRIRADLGVGTGSGGKKKKRRK